MCVYCVENVLTASTYIALNALEILKPSVGSINLYSIDGISFNNTASIDGPGQRIGQIVSYDLKNQSQETGDNISI